MHWLPILVISTWPDAFVTNFFDRLIISDDENVQLHSPSRDVIRPWSYHLGYNHWKCLRYCSHRSRTEPSERG